MILRKYKLQASPLRMSQLLSDYNDGSLSVDYILKNSENLQRPVVWNEQLQKNFVKSLLSGLPVPSLIILESDPSQETYRYVIDGKQRVTAITNYLNSKLQLDLENGHGPCYFNELDTGLQAEIKGFQVPVSIAQSNDFDDNEVIKLFLSINVSGIPQDPEHIKSLQTFLT